MNTCKDKAVKRFDKLWEAEGNKLLSADVVPSIVINGEIHPIDYCISTIARLMQQPSGNEIVRAIRKSLSGLFELADTQFIYPDESLHVSLLGCTQREVSADVFDHEHINKIKDICVNEIEKQKPAQILLKGVGIIGNQIFIQGIPLDINWEELRTSIADSLENNGEHPISYEDKSPIHINIIRIVDADRDRLAALHKVVSQLRDVELGIITLSTIEFVITDFCVSKNRVVWLDQMKCCDSPV